MNNIAGQDNRFGILMFDPNTQQIAGVGTVVEVSYMISSKPCIAVHRKWM